MIAGTQYEKEEQPFLLGNIITRSRPRGIIAWLQARVTNLAPIGYEDETGFHYGVQSDSIPCVSASDENA